MDNVCKFKYKDNIIQLKCTDKLDILYNNLDKNKKFYESSYLEFIFKNKELLFEDINKLIVIDVGANIGNHTIFFSKIMNCQVFSFEPQKIAYDCLCQNIILNDVSNKVVAREFGISAKVKPISIIKSNANMCGSTEWWYNNLGTIQSLPLDHLFYDKIDLIKIDVQGMELEVLKGAENLITKYKPIIMIEITKIEGNLISEVEFNQWLIKHNYDFFDKTKNSFKNNAFLIGPYSKVNLKGANV